LGADRVTGRPTRHERPRHRQERRIM
jgi:hypothetical protein